MNYIKQLNAFYDWLQENRLSTSAFALYFALLMANNKCGWADWFQRTNQSLCGLMGIDEKTLIRARNELKQKGLIDFKSGSKRGEITKYKIINLTGEKDGEILPNKCLDGKITAFPPVEPPAFPPAFPPVEPPDIYKLKTKTETDICNNSISNEIVSADADTPSQVLRQTKENIPYQQIADLYNRVCLSLPKVEKLTDKRRRHIKAAWKNFKGDISVFEKVFRRAEASDFLSGRSGKWTGCNFDWLITYNNMVKVLEGTYDNKVMGGYSDGRNSQHRRSDEKNASTGTYDKFYE
ncbi:hypothetical protein TthWC1_2388 [Thermoanaerobacter thermohydrosulfuricus WC1]|uniref:Uncharacterized protein n=1 Tax=Thermoanaerobacter thermohydrosulfuricus WC1 TaxID=1198630 RepID=M8CLP3_THETY|nr:hypothetical protein TthWC1_2388 [Thermoanaerobacter thermohydrosulfuricus WC1]